MYIYRVYILFIVGRGRRGVGAGIVIGRIRIERKTKIR